MQSLILLAEQHAKYIEPDIREVGPLSLRLQLGGSGERETFLTSAVTV
ncbi:hypothetical protein [Burkholderia sp. IMCC1007]|nr:hypothetical protein [Burkholderia sp. IMCC1007]